MIRVLLVEDQEIVRRGLKTLLETILGKLRARFICQ